MLQVSSPSRRDVLRSASGAVAATTCGVGCGHHADSSSSRPAGPTGPPSSGAASDRATPAGRAPRGPVRFPGLPPRIAHGPRDGSAVALTFHGQGDAELARSLLSEAERAGARVTVLAVGTWLDEHPEMARRVLDGGHELGNHTMRHRDVCALPADEAYAEITECADRLRRLTGTIGGWFRPSQARTATDLVTRLSARAGYPHVLSYDVDSLDFQDPGPDAVRDAVLGQVRAGSVVSLHFGHSGTLTALPAVLDGLRRRGLRAVTATELMHSDGVAATAGPGRRTETG
ncbi:polysaccharide deacetylase family protein [Streptomyces sp. DASNCL29]|uniref:polysaccharide deacetylase family protein n=1 Tax=Streptomyces sp. DASNCL29 TaxID=2583819 RepID=UPI00110F71D6|nr:polysaccharide deacetylase family protein [Streptomyces sp. DASNCL29]TMU99428.1 polysaccharide deacetylase family protein [Streptomyces sp. DASNCL29]